MDNFDWIRNHINGWNLKEEYIEYYRNTIMVNTDIDDSPYDGFFGIPSWKETLALRNDVLDKTSEMHRYLIEIGQYEKSVEQLKIVTFKEYVKEFYPFYNVEWNEEENIQVKE
jgi:hypothetical protein